MGRRRAIALVDLLDPVQVHRVLHQDARGIGLDGAVALLLQRLVGVLEAVGALEDEPVGRARVELGCALAAKRVVGVVGEVYGEHGPVEGVRVGEEHVAGLDEVLELVERLLVEVVAAEGVRQAPRI